MHCWQEMTVQPNQVKGNEKFQQRFIQPISETTNQGYCAIVYICQLNTEVISKVRYDYLTKIRYEKNIDIVLPQETYLIYSWAEAHQDQHLNQI